jgi:hypothetical protein
MKATRNATTRPFSHRSGAPGAPGGARAAIMELLEARQLLTGDGAGAVVFVGSDVADREGVAAIFAEAEVVFLQSGRGALNQISETLTGREGLSSVQFFTHGSAGAVELGDVSLDAEVLASLARDVAGWGKALAPDGDILLWGCDVGAGAAGAKFVREFARLTGADVGASTNLTGAKSLGGDWVLERTHGAVTQRISSAVLDAYRGTLGNDSPDISGAEAAQAVNDNATITPFDNVFIVDGDGDAFLVTLTLDDAAKGVFTPASLIASGFADAGGGAYTFMAADFVAAHEAMILLEFDPADNRVAVGMTETTTITITADDGISPASVDSTTTIVSTSVNDLPVIGGTVAGQMVNDNALVLPFANVTISDADNPDQVVQVTITIDDVAKGMFTTESLIASGFFDEVPGAYFTIATRAAAEAGIRLLAFNPTDNRVAPGLTETSMFTIEVLDVFGPAVLDTTTTVISTSVNVAPTITGAAAGQAVLDTGTVTPFANVTIGDADSPAQTQTVSVTLDAAAKGVFTPASLTTSGFADAGGGVYTFTGDAAAATTAIRQLAFDPTNNRVAPGMTETTTFTISVNDGVAAPATNSTTTVVATSVNDAPTLTTISTLAGASARRTYTIAYADLLAASNAADADPGAVVSFRVESVQSGQLLKNGVAVTPGMTTLAAGESLEWRSAAGASGVTPAFTVVASDGTLVSTPVAVSLNVAAIDPNTAAEGERVSIATDATGLTTVATRNDAGQLIVMQQQGANGQWQLIDLSGVAGIGTILGEPQAFVDPTDANSGGHGTYVAVTTSAGVLLVWNEGGTWMSRNITNEVSGASITGDLITFATIDGRQVLAGFSAGGDLVINFQNATTGAGEATWQATNLYERLRNQSESTPAYASALTAYVTSWNGLNIAGLDENGSIWTVWTGGGLDEWHSTNISVITGAPALVGNLAAYTTGWGGINLAGIDTNGDLTVSWWVPQFVGNWVNTNLSDQFGGPALQGESMTAYVTPWSALNITGLNADGDVVQYWWVPPPHPDQWNITNLTVGQSMDLPRFAGRLTGLATPDARLNVVGQSEDGHILRVWWSPTTTWVLEDLTVLV